jgi:TonB-dependent receptor
MFAIHLSRNRHFVLRPLAAAMLAALHCAGFAQGVRADTENPAQGTATAASVNALSTVVITGIRRSNQKAIDAKLEFSGIADVLSASEAQALPDLTTVETLRRLPGISVLPTLDNEHPRDESATPVIRGLGAAYNSVTIDGVPIASPGTPNGNLGSVSRGVRLDILPSSMISEILVAKTFSADQDAHGIGGAIDLKTRSAFERGGKPFFSMDAALGSSNDISKPRDQDPLGKRLTATGSTTFGPDRKYGVVVSANYQTMDSTTDTHMTTDTVHESFYNNAGVLQTGNSLGNGYAVPQQDKYWYVQNSRTRYGVTAKLEAKFSDELNGFVTGGHYVFHDNMERNELIIDPRNRGTVLNQTATSGQYPGGGIEVGFSRQKTTTATDSLQTGFNWDLAPEQVLSLRAAASRATYREPILMVKYATGIQDVAPGSSNTTTTATPNYALTYDTSSLNHSFNISPTAYNNLSNYKLSYYRPDSDYVRSASDAIQFLRLDYRNNTESKGWGSAAGVSYTHDTPSYSVARSQYTPNTTANQTTLADVLGPTGAPLMYNQSNLNLLTIDPGRAVAYAEALRAAGGLNSIDQSAFNNQDNFEHTENILGTYGMLTYASDKLKSNFGLHVDSTNQSTVGRARVAGAWTTLTTSSSYRFVLPSGQLTYQVTPDTDVRLGASQTIGRPSYDSYAARTSINFANPGDQGNPNATGVSVIVGNPDIKPRLSTNLDLGMNWKLPIPSGGLISVAAFNKGIKDEIFNSASQGFVYDGVTYANATVSKPTNATSASITGLESSVVVNSLGWLHPAIKDFGFSVNWSLLKGGMDVLTSNGSTRRLDRLTGQPDQTRNLTAFYSNGDIELRAAYNYQGKALRSIVPDTAWQDLYWDPREQVDLQASYKIRPGVTLVSQVQNVTHSRIASTAGYAGNLLKDTYSIPTVFWVGLRFTPSF